jgi:hypothetical protein
VDNSEKCAKLFHSKVNFPRIKGKKMQTAVLFHNAESNFKPDVKVFHRGKPVEN